MKKIASAAALALTFLTFHVLAGCGLVLGGDLSVSYMGDDAGVQGDGGEPDTLLSVVPPSDGPPGTETSADAADAAPGLDGSPTFDGPSNVDAAPSTDSSSYSDAGDTSDTGDAGTTPPWDGSHYSPNTCNCASNLPTNACHDVRETYVPTPAMAFTECATRYNQPDYIPVWCQGPMQSFDATCFGVIPVGGEVDDVHWKCCPKP